jgi:hypothetical protein
MRNAQKDEIPFADFGDTLTVNLDRSLGHPLYPRFHFS